MKTSSPRILRTLTTALLALALAAVPATAQRNRDKKTFVDTTSVVVVEVPVTVTRDNRPVEIDILHKCDRRSVDRVRVLHAGAVRSQHLLRGHGRARHERPDFLATLGTAAFGVANHAQHAVVRGHSQIDRGIAGITVTRNRAVVERQRAGMQRVTEYPFARIIRVQITIQIVDVETARIGNQLFSLSIGGDLKVGPQRGRRCARDIEIRKRG